MKLNKLTSQQLRAIHRLINRGDIDETKTQITEKRTDIDDLQIMNVSRETVALI